MNRLFATLALLGCCAVALAKPQIEAAPAPAVAKTDKPEAYQRVRDQDDGTITLELATRTFARKGDKAASSPRIDLVAAVHIADQTFYDARQQSLDGHDLVLFEGVRPPGTGAIAADATDEQRSAATRGRMAFLKGAIEAHQQREGSFPRDLDDLVAHATKRWRSVFEGVRVDGWNRPLRYEHVNADIERKTPERVVLVSDVADGTPRRDDTGDLRVEVEAKASARQPNEAPGGIQLKLAQAFGLVFQLEAMDSSKPNWRSSDMSVDQLMARFKDSGADASALLGMLDGSSFIARLAGFFLDIIANSPQMRAMAKMGIVEAIGASDGMGAFGGAGLGKSLESMMKVIVEDRNVVVVNDLRALIESDTKVKTIAVFYGAGHMGDLERRLRDELGYEPIETTWTIAIRADPKAAGLTPSQAKSVRESLRKMLERAATK